MTTKAERDAFVADLIAQPEKYRREWGEQARRENPQMTDEQIEAAWDQLAEQMGLGR
jgi:hypothetical protein